MLLYGMECLMCSDYAVGLLKEFNMTGTLQLNGLFHFLSAQVYRCKIPEDPSIMIISRGFYLKV